MSDDYRKCEEWQRALRKSLHTFSVCACMCVCVGVYVCVSACMCEGAIVGRASCPVILNLDLIKPY